MADTNNNPFTNITKKDRKTKNLIVSAVFLIIFGLLSILSWLWWLVILLWIMLVVYFWLIYGNKLQLEIKFSYWWVIATFSVVSLVLIFITLDNKENKDSTNTTSKSLTSEQCKTYYDQYNGKVLKVNSDGLEGTIAVKIDTSKGCRLLGWYNFLLSYNLHSNNYKRDIGTPAYNYIVMLRKSDQEVRTKYDGYGALMGAYKNVTQLPDVYAEGKDRSKLYSDGAERIETRYFYWGYKIDTDFSESRYQEILDDRTLQIVDGLPYVEEKLLDDGGYSWGINTDRAAMEGNVVKTYTLSIE